jgi:hypothetical protein
MLSSFYRVLMGMGLLAAGMLLATGNPKAAPALVVVLAGSTPALIKGWIPARGTELRAALVWAFAAVALAILGELVGWSEVSDKGHPIRNQWIYLSVLAALAALLSVLNARTPGSGAWALLMAMLIVVLLLPWLEGAWMLRQREGWDRLRITFPWNYFLALLMITGVSNYVSTRFGPAAIAVGIGFALSWLGLTRTGWSYQTRGDLFAWIPWCWVVAISAAEWLARPSAKGTEERPPLDVVWLWFRDHWGSVWALRIRDRFNLTAAAADWPIRLGWRGTLPTNPADQLGEIPEEAVATFTGLIRRFASRSRISSVLAPEVPPKLADPQVRRDD